MLKQLQNKLYFIDKTRRPGYAGTTTHFQIVWNIQKNYYLNPRFISSHTKYYLSNFPIQTNPRQKITNPKKSYDHPRHLKYPLPPPPGYKLDFECLNSLHNSFTRLFCVTDYINESGNFRGGLINGVFYGTVCESLRVGIFCVPHVKVAQSSFLTFLILIL